MGCACCKRNERQLLAAAQCGRGPFMGTLLFTGANVNTRYELGFTSLMYAAHNGQYGCLKLLLNAGANLNARDTAVLAAAENGHDECLELCYVNTNVMLIQIYIAH